MIPIDFSRFASGFRPTNRGTFTLAFTMGAVAALLAGACVAPVVIQVVLFSSSLYAGGTTLALALPFFLGLGMALPWPIAGAAAPRGKSPQAPCGQTSASVSAPAVLPLADLDRRLPRRGLVPWIRVAGAMGLEPVRTQGGSNE